MLTKLHIKDFAIIDEITLELASGFNVFTGETGAGKSIIIDAVDFAMGGHSDLSVIRAGADRALVELTYFVPPVLRSEIRSLVQVCEADFDEHHITLAREIRDTGRSVARVNGTTCKLAIFREIGSLLMDIHGQSEHLSLLKPRNHIFLLDRFGDLEEPREGVAELVRKLNAIRRTISSLQQNERDREHRIDMLQYQISEIEAARLRDGEEDELREERNRLGNSEKLAKLSEEAYEALYGEDAMGSSGIDALNRAAVTLSRLAALDEKLKDESDLAETLAVQAEELARTLRRYTDDLEVSPGRLEDVEERLELITRLKRKYGDSIKAVLEYATRAREELTDIELGEERLEALQQEEDELLRSIGDLAKSLTKARIRAGERLSKQIVEELSHLRMEGTRFEVTITQEEAPDGCYVNDERLTFDATGVDQVEFFMSANPGMPLQPVAKVASGGETARIMLALKTVLAKADRTPTLIFDEIDQGIGGRVGGVVGEKLWGLSKQQHQVLCVTHLAQIAGFADTHFRVQKRFQEKQTTTKVEKLSHNQIIQEMAAMLGSSTETAQQNAQELYAYAEGVKRGEQSWVEQPKLI